MFAWGSLAGSVRLDNCLAVGLTKPLSFSSRWGMGGALEPALVLLAVALLGARRRGGPGPRQGRTVTGFAAPSVRRLWQLSSWCGPDTPWGSMALPCRPPMYRWLAPCSTGAVTNSWSQMANAYRLGHLMLTIVAAMSIIGIRGGAMHLGQWRGALCQAPYSAPFGCRPAIGFDLGPRICPALTCKVGDVLNGSLAYKFVRLSGLLMPFASLLVRQRYALMERRCSTSDGAEFSAGSRGPDDLGSVFTLNASALGNLSDALVGVTLGSARLAFGDYMVSTESGLKMLTDVGTRAAARMVGAFVESLIEDGQADGSGIESRRLDPTGWRWLS